MKVQWIDLQFAVRGMTLSLLLDYSNLIVTTKSYSAILFDYVYYGCSQSENETSVIIFISTRQSSSFSTFSLRQYGTGCGLKNRGTELGSTKSLTEAPFKVPKWVLNNFLCLAMRESNGDVKWSILAQKDTPNGLKLRTRRKIYGNFYFVYGK